MSAFGVNDQLRELPPGGGPATAVRLQLHTGWPPYVEVDDIDAAADLARALRATIWLSTREEPAGWRSVVRTPASGEMALWQQKR